MISVRESGEIQGVVQKGRPLLAGRQGPQPARLHSRKADEGEMPPFECGNDDAFALEERIGVGVKRPRRTPTTLSGTVLDQTASRTSPSRPTTSTTQGSATRPNALDYMADLIGYADVTYSREVNTDMQIGFARLWTTGADQ